jgi:hypothetical protein
VTGWFDRQVQVRDRGKSPDAAGFHKPGKLQQ